MARKRESNQEPLIKSAFHKCGSNRLEEVSETVEKFSTGTIVITQGASTQIPFEEVLCGLFRHIFGDWGDLETIGWEENEFALANGLRLLSRYRTECGLVFWIITEHDRSVTTILLPIEY